MESNKQNEEKAKISLKDAVKQQLEAKEERDTVNKN